MAISRHELDHLLSLIEAAKVEAGRLGPPLAEAVRNLDAATRAVGQAEVAGGRAEEGLRPDELNTANDK